MRNESQCCETADNDVPVSHSRFKDLRVWQGARELARGVYHACRSQKLRTDPALVHQMTRAAVSVVSNIAEGHERGSRAQNVEFCFYAKGSVGELRSQIIIAHDVNLLDDTASGWLQQKCEEVSVLLGSYIRHMQTNPRLRSRPRTPVAVAGKGALHRTHGSEH